MAAATIDTVAHALRTANLPEYFAERGNYAGATFMSIAPNDPFDITAADLHAVSMLSVSVGPAATRRLLGPGPDREAVLAALAAVPVGVRLESATSEHFDAAWKLQLALKRALAPHGKTNSNRWVTAAKLSARKRPLLIPVRDNVVTKAIGRQGDAREYWKAVQEALNAPEVIAALDEARVRLRVAADSCEYQASNRPESVECGPVTHEDEALRLIDVALWMVHRPSGVAPLSELDE